MSTQPNISQEAEQDYDVLLERIMPLIEHWIQQQDGFVPCACAIATDGQVVGHMIGTVEATTKERAMHALFTGLQERAQAGKIRASCVCCDGGFEEDGEFVAAIVIILEHLRGPATILHRPYMKNPDGTYGYAQMEGRRVPSEIFAGL